MLDHVVQHVLVNVQLTVVVVVILVVRVTVRLDVKTVHQNVWNTALQDAQMHVKHLALVHVN